MHDQRFRSQNSTMHVCVGISVCVRLEIQVVELEAFL